MTILIICSKRFYPRIPDIREQLERAGHTVRLPNCFDDATAEERHRGIGREEHARFKARMYQKSTAAIEKADAVLVLNFEKDGTANYIGGATFLEMYDAFRLGKKIYLMNTIPAGIIHDEIVGFSPVLIGGDLGMIG